MKKLSLIELKKNADQVLSKDELKGIKGGTMCNLPGTYNYGTSVSCYNYQNVFVNTICVASPSCYTEMALVANCNAVNGYMSTGHAFCS